MQPAVVVPAPRTTAPRCLTSISASKLALILFIRRTIERTGPERTEASAVAPSGAASTTARPPTWIPAATSARLKAFAAASAGLSTVLPATRARSTTRAESGGDSFL
jgi:hypothetical protein